MIKTSRKQSTDPVQEQLRQEKDSWNKDVSAFIDDVKHFKKLINGYASKFHSDKSKINDPIPSDPATIIGSLANDFNELSQRCSKIISYQLEYSKNRKKKQLKATEPGYVKAEMQHVNLTSYASNTVSRFFARILNPSFGNSEKHRIKRYRMTMLTSCVNISDNLEKLSRTIAQSSPESIFVSSQILNKIIDEFNFINKGFETFINSKDNKVKPNANSDKPKSDSDKPVVDSDKPKSDSDEPKVVNDPEFDETEVKNNKRKVKKENVSKDKEVANKDIIAADQAVIDYRNNVANFLDFDLKKLNSLVISFVNSDMSIKNKISKELLIAYNQLLLDINSRNKTSGNSLKEIFEIINKSDLQVVAQSLMSKYFGKLQHQMSVFDKTSAIRLDIYNSAEDAKKIINKIMDLLEKDMNVNELALQFSNISELLYNIMQYQSALNSTVKGKNFNKPFMNLLDNRSIFDHDLDLSEKQKINIRKNIEQKDVRELAKLYKLQQI